MKKVLFSLVLVATLAFATSTGHVQNSHPVKQQTELFVPSSNFP
jgi:hypothetical protein